MPSPLPDNSHLSANLRQSLDEIRNDIEGILHRLGNAADEQTEELREKVSDALSRLRSIQSRTQARFHAAGHQTQEFVHEKPWAAIAAAAVAAYVVGFLSRPRH